MFAYHVHCQFSESVPNSRDAQSPEDVLQAWVEWLISEHLADVIAAGAIDGDVVVWDGTPRSVEVRYRFDSREAFEEYERDHAPRLRAEGLKRFPPAELGMTFQRRTGEIRFSTGPNRPSSWGNLVD